MNKKQLLKEWVIPIVLVIGAALLIRKFIFFNAKIPSTSMVPTLNVEDRLMITKIYDSKNIKRGDIIVFYSDELNKRLIKRAIGVPGDHIVIHNGVVNINGTDINEEYVKNNNYYDGEFDVPEDKYFFLGDNRACSNDARGWKNPYIGKEKIEGKAVFRYYPFDSIEMINNL